LTYTPTAGGTAVTIAGLKDVDGEFKADELDSTDHGTAGWKSRMYGLLDFEGTAKLDYIAVDPTQEFLLQSLIGRTAVSIVLLPEVATGSGEDSYSGSVLISSFKWSGKMADLQSVDIALKGAGPFTIVTQ